MTQHFESLDQELRLGGLTARISIEHDDYMGAPWKENDGHGPVRVTRDRSYLTNRPRKEPGERVLHDSRFEATIYDFKAALSIAKRDWVSSTGPHRKIGYSVAEAAVELVEADFARLKAWCNDEWQWVYVAVTVSHDGTELGRASLSGIESDAGEYLLEIANELLPDALIEAGETARAIYGALPRLEEDEEDEEDEEREPDEPDYDAPTLDEMHMAAWHVKQGLR